MNTPDPQDLDTVLPGIQSCRALLPLFSESEQAKKQATASLSTDQTARRRNPKICHKIPTSFTSHDELIQYMKIRFSRREVT
jgi:hypothetical protein